MFRRLSREEDSSRGEFKRREAISRRKIRETNKEIWNLFGRCFLSDSLLLFELRYLYIFVLDVYEKKVAYDNRLISFPLFLVRLDSIEYT